MFRFKAEDVDEIFKEDDFFAIEFKVTEVDEEFGDAYFSMVCNKCGEAANHHYLAAKNCFNHAIGCESCGYAQKFLPDAFYKFIEKADEEAGIPVDMEE